MIWAKLSFVRTLQTNQHPTLVQSTNGRTDKLSQTVLGICCFWQVLCCLESCIVLLMWVSNLAGSHFSFLHSLVPKIGFAKTVVRSLWHFWGIFNWLIPMFLLRICFPFPHTTELLNAEIRLKTHWQQNGPTSIKYDPSSAPLTVFWDIAGSRVANK